MLSHSSQAPIRERVDEEHRWARVTVFIRDADYSRIDNVLRAAERETSDQGLGHKIVPFGDGWISYLTVRLLVEGQASSIALALVTDLILITILLGSVRMGLIAVLPVAFSLLLVLAALALAGTPLGIANSMFAGIALGIGLDFAIHLTTAYRQRLSQGMPASEALRSTLELTGPAVCVSAASITAGFSVLLLSEIAPNVQLGVMICLCLLTCAVTTLLLIPSLLRLWKVGPDRQRCTGFSQIPNQQMSKCNLVNSVDPVDSRSHFSVSASKKGRETRSGGSVKTIGLREMLEQTTGSALSHDHRPVPRPH